VSYEEMVNDRGVLRRRPANLAVKCATNSETVAVGGAVLGLRRAPSVVPAEDGRVRRSMPH